jgi:hypothetical protein
MKLVEDPSVKIDELPEKQAIIRHSMLVQAGKV